MADRASQSWTSRITWLVLIWAASVAALGVAATLMRRVMGMVGLTG